MKLEDEAAASSAKDKLRDRVKELEVVSEGLKRTTDRDAVRMMIAELFTEVYYLAPGHQWIASLELDREGINVASGGYLLPFMALALWSTPTLRT